MLSYQRGAPELKAICERHGVPYTRESVFVRLRKTLDIMIGAASMRRWPEGRLDATRARPRSTVADTAEVI